MCSVVIDGSQEFSTVNKLAAYLGGVDRIVFAPEYETINFDSCLCQIDLEATMLACGKAGRFDEVGDFRVAAA